MKSILNLCFAGLITLLMSGCGYFLGQDQAFVDRDLVRTSYQAVDMLLKGVKNISALSENPTHNGVYTNPPILVASFVNIDNVQRSSTFGRVIAEQMASRLSQKGYKVIEMKMRSDSIFIQEHTGELMLSRKLRTISNKHNAYAVIVGTYGVSKYVVYLTAKLIRTKDNVILSAYDYSLPVGPDTKIMLRR
jgi:TolB-like protein